MAKRDVLLTRVQQQVLSQQVLPYQIPDCEQSCISKSTQLRVVNLKDGAPMMVKSGQWMDDISDVI